MVPTFQCSAKKSLRIVARCSSVIMAGSVARQPSSRARRRETKRRDGRMQSQATDRRQAMHRTSEGRATADARGSSGSASVARRAGSGSRSVLASVGGEEP
jgi:hypothetical protein